jgi:hypothetical protein
VFLTSKLFLLLLSEDIHLNSLMTQDIFKISDIDLLVPLSDSRYNSNPFIELNAVASPS